MSALDGHRSLFIHQYDQLSETTIAQICGTATRYAGADVLLKKVFDASAIMGPNIDHDPLAIDSIATFRAQQAEAAANGSTLLPWVNPVHEGDAAAHAELGAPLIVDLEPYAGFFQDGPVGVRAYLASLRARGVSEILVSIDPRPNAMAALDVASWASTVDALVPQVYFTDFGEPAMASVAYLQACVALNPVCVPALPYNGTAGDLLALWNAAQALGCRGVSLWRMGTAGPAALQAFGALPLADADPCSALRAQVDDLTRQLAAANTRIAAAMLALGGG